MLRVQLCCKFLDILSNVLNKYIFFEFNSYTDEAFIAEVPELSGCMADGKTYQEALTNAETVINEWIETAIELERNIPQPVGKLMFA